MIEERDIWDAAKLLVDRLDQNAIPRALERADTLLVERDLVEWAVWHRIEEACREQPRTVPGPSEPVS